MDLKLVYVTSPTVTEAKKIGRILVEKRLAACVNILNTVESLFWWEGEIQDAREVVFIAKTTERHVPQLIDTVKENHSYECPCIVILGIEAGNPDFLKWIANETSRS